LRGNWIGEVGDRSCGGGEALIWEGMRRSGEEKRKKGMRAEGSKRQE